MLTIALIILYIVLIPFFWTRLVQADGAWWTDGYYRPRPISDEAVATWSVFGALVWPIIVGIYIVLTIIFFIGNHTARFFKWMPRYVNNHRK